MVGRNCCQSRLGAISLRRKMAEYVVRNQTRVPTHPGELMREIIEEHALLSVTDAARRMGVSRQALHAVLRGRSAVSADMALRFAQLTGGRAELFLRMQENLDLWLARQRLGGRLAGSSPSHPSAPPDACVTTSSIPTSRRLPGGGRRGPPTTRCRRTRRSGPTW